jgi:hypothetical protein
VTHLHHFRSFKTSILSYITWQIYAGPPVPCRQTSSAGCPDVTGSFKFSRHSTLSAWAGRLSSCPPPSILPTQSHTQSFFEQVVTSGPFIRQDGNRSKHRPNRPSSVTPEAGNASSKSTESPIAQSQQRPTYKQQSFFREPRTPLVFTCHPYYARSRASSTIAQRD